MNRCPSGDCRLSEKSSRRHNAFCDNTRLDDNDEDSDDDADGVDDDNDAGGVRRQLCVADAAACRVQPGTAYRSLITGFARLTLTIEDLRARRVRT